MNLLFTLAVVLLVLWLLGLVTIARRRDPRPPDPRPRPARGRAPGRPRRRDRVVSIVTLASIVAFAFGLAAEFESDGRNLVGWGLLVLTGALIWTGLR